MTLRRTFLAASLAAASLLSLPAAAQIQERTIKFPSASNKGHPQVLGVEKFAELVKQKSGGKLTVSRFRAARSAPTCRPSRPCRAAPSR